LDSKEFRLFLKSMLAEEEDVARNGEDIVLIRIMPDLNVAINRSALNDENRLKFIKAVQTVPNVHRGLSHLAMTDVGTISMDKNTSLICQAVGRAFKLWSLMPMDLEKSSIDQMVKDDSFNLLPSNTGLDTKGVPGLI